MPTRRKKSVPRFRRNKNKIQIGGDVSQEVIDKMIREVEGLSGKVEQLIQRIETENGISIKPRNEPASLAEIRDAPALVTPNPLALEMPSLETDTMSDAATAGTGTGTGTGASTINSVESYDTLSPVASEMDETRLPTPLTQPVAVDTEAEEQDIIEMQKKTEDAITAKNKENLPIVYERNFSPYNELDILKFIIPNDANPSDLIVNLGGNPKLSMIVPPNVKSGETIALVCNKEDMYIGELDTESTRIISSEKIGEYDAQKAQTTSVSPEQPESLIKARELYKNKPIPEPPMNVAAQQPPPQMPVLNEPHISDEMRRGAAAWAERGRAAAASVPEETAAPAPVQEQLSGDDWAAGWESAPGLDKYPSPNPVTALPESAESKTSDDTLTPLANKLINKSKLNENRTAIINYLKINKGKLDASLVTAWYVTLNNLDAIDINQPNSKYVDEINKVIAKYEIKFDAEGKIISGNEEESKKTFYKKLGGTRKAKNKRKTKKYQKKNKQKSNKRRKYTR